MANIINTKIIKQCKFCKSDFSVFPSLTRIMFCSKNCYYKGKIGYKVKQETKQKISSTMKEKGIKPKIVLRGDKSNFWKGGVNKENKSLRRQIRDSLKYKHWRESIMKQDDYTCQICKKRGCYLEVDHYPYSFSQIMNTFIGVNTLEDSYLIDFLWNLENGRTLCKQCHQLYGNKNFTKTGITLFDEFS